MPGSFSLLAERKTETGNRYDASVGTESLRRYRKPPSVQKVERPMWATKAPFTIRVRSWEALPDLWIHQKPVPLLVTHVACQIFDPFPEAMIHFSASTEALPGFFGNIGAVPDSMNIWMRMTDRFPMSPAIAETWVEDPHLGIMKHTAWELQNMVDTSGEPLSEHIVGEIVEGGGAFEQTLFDAFTRFRGGDVEFDTWLA